VRGAKHVVGSQSSLQPCNPYILCLHTEGLCHESFGQLRKIEHLNVLERKDITLRNYALSLPHSLSAATSPFPLAAAHSAAPYAYTEPRLYDAYPDLKPGPGLRLSGSGPDEFLPQVTVQVSTPGPKS